ncbi:hypothetical protein [Methylobacterium nodulans]|uniref:Uncharacterized protein n=1 Tax=Methylobacterium nodulans (strain LMG 21967 / CNCM I-2342 / ORS 2060) TaxID=460265 RepID=B8IUZ3_METNO|nr:hypothetical protein [Methylobacterium nodulans]ACL59051.1 hypothetical protein Mnod_4173 [Methylobacterium nodulans ORS 2060]
MAERRRLETRLPFRSAGPALLLGLACGLASGAAAAAQDAERPLLLRIHPRGESSILSDGDDEAETVRRAIAAREAFEARITARARRAIASVCTGCLAPEAPVTGSIAPLRP